MSKILIGIDTGVKTGFAKSVDGTLTEIKTLSIVAAMERVLAVVKEATTNNDELTLYIEDARLRTWIEPTAGREKLQGVGAVKRDAKIWEEFCEHYGLSYHLIAPKNNNTKLKEPDFKRITSWTGRTSGHARDATMLIFKR